MAEYPPLAREIVAAAVPHVVFDGWSAATLNAACDDVGASVADAAALFPRGGVDLAIAFHKLGDETMVQTMAARDLSALKYREKITAYVRARLELIDDKETVRKGSTLFSLPQNMADGTALIWGTSDAIWNALGDTSDDFNWYSKRTTLSGVYSATVLYWLGDNSEDHADTWAFLDRRIDNVMQFEKLKSDVRSNPLTAPLARLAGQLVSGVRAPRARPNDLPGKWETPK